MIYLPVIFPVDCCLIIHRFFSIYSLYIFDLITPRPGTALHSRLTDGGNSTEAYALFRGMLSDAIAMESTRYPEDNFVAV